MALKAVTAPLGSPVGGSGTHDTIPVWNTATTLTDSILSQTGGNAIRLNGITFFAGTAGTGTGGNYRITDDSGADKWLMGLLGSAGARDWTLYDIVSAQPRLTVDNSGNIGINTTSPYALVSARGAAGVGIGAWSTSGASPGVPVAASLFLGDGNFYNAGFYNQAPGLSAVYDATLGNAGALALYYYNGGSRAEGARLNGVGNLQFNSGYGSVVTAYGCRAWVNFNGTGTVAIRGSGNVSSITDLGVGNYQVNFAAAMPDVNYAPTVACGHPGGAGTALWAIVDNTVTTQQVGSFRVLALSNLTTAADAAWYFAQVVR